MEERLRRLENEIAVLRDDLRVLRGLVENDPASALNKIRYVTEKVLHGLCAEHGVSWGSAEPTLERMIGPLLAKEIIPRNVGIHVRTIQSNASPGSHFQASALGSAHVEVAQRALLEFLEWHFASNQPPEFPREQLAPALASGNRGGARRTRLVGGGVALVCLLVGATVAVVAFQTPTEAGPPTAGLDAVERYRNGWSAGSGLDSVAFWRVAGDDFRRALNTEWVPRWAAGARLADGCIALLQDDIVSARSDYEAAVELDPSWSVGHAALASVLLRSGDFDDAIASAEHAQLLEPGWWVPVALVGRAHGQAGELERAVPDLMRAYELSGRSPTLLGELALLHHARGFDRQALIAASEALDADPNVIPALVVRAERRIEAGDGEGALEFSSHAAAVAPSSALVLLLHADALAMTGAEDDAMSTYRRALAGDGAGALNGASPVRLREVRAALAEGVLPTLRHRQPVLLARKAALRRQLVEAAEAAQA
ncbi:MAG: hypothetical protein KC492_24555, partial [Myxococcales bacterium]|nr:hypothetical protein [Myxococcales bacterium]